jgi:hypothetical protein
MTGGLSQRIETKESFVRGEGRFVLGVGSRTAGKHSKVIRKRGGFARIEQVFDETVPSTLVKLPLAHWKYRVGVQ